MSDLLPTLLDFPPSDGPLPGSNEYDTLAKELATSLTRLPESSWSIAGDDHGQVTDLLNPAINSLPYAFALQVQCTHTVQNTEKVDEALTKAIVFCTSFDPIQMRYGGFPFRKIMEWMIATISNAAIPDFSPVTTALLRVDSNCATFTSTHLLLVRQCLVSAVPSQALPILSKDIHFFPQRVLKAFSDDNLSDIHVSEAAFITTESGFSLGLRTEHVLEYHLLGAHVYIGMRNFNRARLFLEYVLLVPSPYHTHSGLQIEAYKKWVLVGLIANGAQYHLPRTHDQQVMKSVRAASKAYDTLAEDFEKRDWRKYQAEAELGEDIWREDGNTRLVKEVGDALLSYWVADLEKTYVAVPVSRVASHLDFTAEQSLQLLSDLIHASQLNASIVQSNTGKASDAVLRFHKPSSSTAKRDSSEHDPEAQALRVRRLVAAVREADRRLQLTREYIEVQRRSKRILAADGDPGDAMEMTWDSAPGMNAWPDDDGDEDLMAG